MGKIGIKRPKSVAIKMWETRRKNGWKRSLSSIEKHKKLDQIEKEFDIELERQYQVAGFFIDGYDEKNNIAYEVDEGYHVTRKGIVKKDIKRENIISNKLNCKFIRIKDY